MSSFCKSYSHFFRKKFQHICVSLDVNFNESLTNNVVSFEQLAQNSSIERRIPFSLNMLSEYLIFLLFYINLQKLKCIFCTCILLKDVCFSSILFLYFRYKSMFFFCYILFHFQSQYFTDCNKVHCVTKCSPNQGPVVQN